MCVLIKNKLTVLFCRCLFPGLRKSGTADEENEDKNKQELEKIINNDISSYFCFYLVLNLSKQFLGSVNL